MFDETRFRQDLSNAIRCEYGIASVDFSKTLNEQVKGFDQIDRIHLAMLIEQVSGKELNIKEFIKVANINNKVEDIVTFVKELTTRKPVVVEQETVTVEEDVMLEGTSITIQPDLAPQTDFIEAEAAQVEVDPAHTVVSDVTADNTEYQIEESEKSVVVESNIEQEEVIDGSVSND